MSIGSFTIIKNEANWVAPHILRVLPFIDEMVFFDGNSTDGTVEIIEEIRNYSEFGHKIRLVKNRDCADLKDDYVRLFNECLRTLTTDLAYFLHPDMWVVNPEQILIVKDSPAVALTTSMRSFGGEPGGDLYEIHGRGTQWKNIYRLRNPDLGCHYFGHYGALEEDCYFSAITGDEHIHHGQQFEKYPYEVVKSGIEVLHFSDVRPLSRRVGRMRECLKNQGGTDVLINEIIEQHPRIILKDASGFAFTPARYPGEFLAAQLKYKHLVKEPKLVHA